MLIVKVETLQGGRLIEIGSEAPPYTANNRGNGGNDLPCRQSLHGFDTSRWDFTLV